MGSLHCTHLLAGNSLAILQRYRVHRLTSTDTQLALDITIKRQCDDLHHNFSIIYVTQDVSLLLTRFEFSKSTLNCLGWNLRPAKLLVTEWQRVDFDRRHTFRRAAARRRCGQGGRSQGRGERARRRAASPRRYNGFFSITYGVLCGNCDCLDGKDIRWRWGGWWWPLGVSQRGGDSARSRSAVRRCCRPATPRFEGKITKVSVSRAQRNPSPLNAVLSTYQSNLSHRRRVLTYFCSRICTNETNSPQIP